jgi:hypothetical protein
MLPSSIDYNLEQILKTVLSMVLKYALSQATEYFSLDTVFSLSTFKADHFAFSCQTAPLFNHIALEDAR